MSVEKNFQFYKEQFPRKEEGLKENNKKGESFDAAWKFFIENENDPHLKLDVNKISEEDAALVKKFYEGTLTEEELEKRLEVDTGLHSKSPNYNLIVALKNKFLVQGAKKCLEKKKKAA